METFNTLLGKKLAGYRLEELLGCGGTAAVYRSVHEELERPVAVKVLLLGSLMPGPLPLSLIDRFRDEAQLAATLKHPNLLPIYDFGVERNIAYLVMHYAPDGSLEDRLNPDSGGGPLSLPESLDYLVQAASALDYIHKRGIVHRDVKPQNLLLEDHGLMLSDFGLARLISGDSAASSPTQTMSERFIRGTPFYLAPEQALGNPVDWRADIYALGVTLYQMLCGHVPFEGDSWSVVIRQIEASPPSLVGQVPFLTSDIEAVVRKALAKQPQDRYQSAGELAGAFRHTVAQHPLAARFRTSTTKTGGVDLRRGPGKRSNRYVSEWLHSSYELTNPPTASGDRGAGTHLLGGKNDQQEAGEYYILTCPTCGFVNRAEAKFCVKDGTALRKAAWVSDPWQG